MSFDLTAELARVTRGLEVVRKEVSDRGPAVLLAQVNLAERCGRIGAKLGQLLREVPPPAPTPPVEYQTIEIEEDGLRPATWRERNFRSKTAPVPDVHSKVPERLTREKTVPLPEQRFPGAPAKTYELPVAFQVATKVELPDEDDDLDLDAAARRKKKARKPKPKPFEYRIATEVRFVEVYAPEVPPDAPLTPAQQAYVDRVEEIRLEVRDITSLVAHLDRLVGGLVADADGLVQSGEALTARVANLPAPADITPDLAAANTRIEAVRNLLPAVEHALNQMEPELPELLRRAQEACPEIA